MDVPLELVIILEFSQASLPTGRTQDHKLIQI